MLTSTSGGRCATPEILYSTFPLPPIRWLLAASLMQKMYLVHGTFTRPLMQKQRITTAWLLDPGFMGNGAAAVMAAIWVMFALVQKHQNGTKTISRFLFSIIT